MNIARISGAALSNPWVRGLHSFASQLNLSRVCHKKNTLHTPNTRKYP